MLVASGSSRGDRRGGVLGGGFLGFCLKKCAYVRRSRNEDALAGRLPATRVVRTRQYARTVLVCMLYHHKKIIVLLPTNSTSY